MKNVESGKVDDVYNTKIKMCLDPCQLEDENVVHDLFYARS